MHKNAEVETFLVLFKNLRPCVLSTAAVAAMFWWTLGAQWTWLTYF